jgi:type VI secretion system protein ImpC
MPKTIQAEVRLGVKDAPERVSTEAQRPFRILLVGDFSGRAWRADSSPALPRLIDRDNFDDVLNAAGVELELDAIHLQFHELEDFHPDRICARLGLFEELDRAAAVVPSPSVAPRPSPGRSLLDQILAENEGPPTTSLEDASDLAAFIRRGTAGHLAPRETVDSRHQEAERMALAGRFLRSILRQPRFQSIESAWRAAFLLVRGLDTGSSLEIWLLDSTVAELIANLDAVRRELARKGDWGCIAANFTFGQSEADIQALTGLAGLASSLRTPFLAEGRLPDDPENPEWERFRHSEEARWIGLAMPRFLLRLPYGKDTSPIESFPFEEMTGSEHAAYLWGNPAFFCAYLIGQSFLMHGWDLGERLARRIDGLPQHIYREDGEPVAKPCAEIWMTECDAGSLLDFGFMPLASVKNEPAALIVRFQSIALPAPSRLPFRADDDPDS